MQGYDHADCVNTLEDALTEVRRKKSVRGVIVLIDHEPGGLELVAAGRYNRAKERIAVALLRMSHWIISKT